MRVVVPVPVSSKFLQNPEYEFLTLDILSIGLITKNLKKSRCLMVNMIIFCHYEKGDRCKSLTLKRRILNHGSHLPHRVLSESNRDVDDGDGRVSDQGFGMDSRSIKILEVRINKYYPLTGASYVGLPTCITDKKSTVTTNDSVGLFGRLSI